MDVEPDLSAVGDGVVMQSTELNGEPGVVDPVMLLLNNETGDETLRVFAKLVSPEAMEHYTVSLNGGNLMEVGSTESSEPSESEDELHDAARPRKQRVEVVIHQQAAPKVPALPVSSTQTGLVYDVLMRMHAELEPEEDEEHHPEDPRRITEIYHELAQADLVYDDEHPDYAEYKLLRIPARHATKQEILLAHKKKHWKWVERLPSLTDEQLLSLTKPPFDSIYANRETFLCATLSCGGAIEACRAVVAGAVKNAIAVIRPPGHHAESHIPGGFCFFNNVCVAARVCQKDFPDLCRKVLILDWDVHHGNGCQEIFYDDPNVLYISIHVYMNGHFYPSSEAGDHLHCGGPNAYGMNVNVPWTTYGMTDADYMHAFQEVVMPIAQAFDPDLVIVAAGFDAADGDELGKCHVTPAGYSQMTHMLMSLAHGKVAVCLEGGYNLRAIAKSALAVTRTLMGEPPDRLDEGLKVSATAVKDVAMVKRQQSRYWKSLFPKEAIDLFSTDFRPERLHDVLREWQSKVLFDEFQMLPLPIHHNSLTRSQSRSFDYSVMATTNHDQDRPLLVIFHDPPEVMGIPDPRTSRLQAHNTWIADVAKTYIEWARENDLAVIDVNIPKHITGSSAGYLESDSEDLRARLTSELAFYLWANYIEVSDTHQIFFIGIGAAYSGLMNLFNQNDRIAQEERIQHIFSFVGEDPLRPIRSISNENIGDWYHSHSTIFVAHSHNAFDSSRQRKLKKKYGNVIQSSKDGINAMLLEHKAEIVAHILEETEDWRLEQKRRQEVSKVNESALPLNRNLRKEEPTALGSPMQSPRLFDALPSPALHSPIKLPPIGFFQTSPVKQSEAPGRARR